MMMLGLLRTRIRLSGHQGVEPRWWKQWTWLSWIRTRGIMGTGNGCSFIEDRQFLTVPLRIMRYTISILLSSLLRLVFKSISPPRSKA